MAKDRNYRRFINSARWQHTRNAYLLDHPLCECCSTEETPVIARCVHHKTPAETARSVREMETLMFATNNLQALCYDCHKQIHYEERSHTKEVVKERERTRVERMIESLTQVRTERAVMSPKVTCTDPKNHSRINQDVLIPMQTSIRSKNFNPSGICGEEIRMPD